MIPRLILLACLLVIPAVAGCTVDDASKPCKKSPCTTQPCPFPFEAQTAPCPSAHTVTMNLQGCNYGTTLAVAPTSHVATFIPAGYNPSTSPTSSVASAVYACDAITLSSGQTFDDTTLVTDVMEAHPANTSWETVASGYAHKIYTNNEGLADFLLLVGQDAVFADLATTMSGNLAPPPFQVTAVREARVSIAGAEVLTLTFAPLAMTAGGVNGNERFLHEQHYMDLEYMLEPQISSVPYAGTVVSTSGPHHFGPGASTTTPVVTAMGDFTGSATFGEFP